MPELHIAIVDDDPGMCRALRRLLKSYQYEVAVFHRGSDFLDSINVQEPACAILDVELPDSNGLEVFDKMHLRFPSLPAIVITAWDDDSIKQIALDKGVYAFFNKPFDEAGFVREISGAIQKRTERF